jgi:hypothetical protein
MLRRFFAAFALLLMLFICERSALASTGTNVLVIASDAVAFRNDVVAKLQGTGRFTQVDLFDAQIATPALTNLQQYASVLVFSDNPFLNSVSLGNVLADYVDGGGRVVICTFAFNSDTLGIGGRFSTDGYMPLTIASQTQNTPLTLVADLPLNSLLDGVTSFSGGSSSYHNQASITNGATLVAHWSDGYPLVVSLKVGTGGVAGLNFFPPSSDARPDFWTSSTSGATLMANALAYAGAGNNALGKNAFLSSLVPSSGTLSPTFSSSVYYYTTTVHVASVTFTATTADANATFTINGVTNQSGVASSSQSLNVGTNRFIFHVTAENGTVVRSYTNNVIRTKSEADISPSNLEQTYDGSAKPISLSVSP